jgi:hypothetical protein
LVSVQQVHQTKHALCTLVFANYTYETNSIP